MTIPFHSFSPPFRYFEATMHTRSFPRNGTEKKKKKNRAVTCQALHGRVRVDFFGEMRRTPPATDLGGFSLNSSKFHHSWKPLLKARPSFPSPPPPRGRDAYLIRKPRRYSLVSQVSGLGSWYLLRGIVVIIIDAR